MDTPASPSVSCTDWHIVPHLPNSRQARERWTAPVTLAGDPLPNFAGSVGGMGCLSGPSTNPSRHPQAFDRHVKVLAAAFAY